MGVGGWQFRLPYTRHPYENVAMHMIFDTSPTLLSFHIYSQPTAKMPKLHTWTEADIDAAMDDMCNGVSLRKAAKNHGIPTTTLSDRVEQRSKAPQAAHESQQRLSDTQEKKIVEWILRQEKLGYAPTHRAVRCVVSRLLKQAGDVRPLGRKWVQHFRKRHPTIRNKKGVIQESIRYDSFTPRAVN